MASVRVMTACRPCTNRISLSVSPERVDWLARARVRSPLALLMSPPCLDASRESTAAANDGLVEPLTQREIEVLTALCDGDSNQNISRRVNVGLAPIKWQSISVECQQPTAQT